MKNPKHFDLLVNVAGVIVGLIVIGYVVYAAVHTEAGEPCGARYPAATRFSLQTSEGKPLSAIELQARAGVRDLGVIDNAAVVRVDGGPSPEALEVKLRKLPQSGDVAATARNGIEFHWAPPGMAKATSVCLSYSLWLPDKFAFADGGTLPGVFASASGQSKTAIGLSVTPQWDREGKPMLIALLEGGDIRRISGQPATLPTNRWIKLDQEVELNAPGKSDGRLRLWVDGSLALEDLNVPLRKDANVLLSGVLVAIGYRTTPAQPSMLRLSPFQLAWR